MNNTDRKRSPLCWKLDAFCPLLFMQPDIWRLVLWLAWHWCHVVFTDTCRRIRNCEGHYIVQGFISIHRFAVATTPCKDPWVVCAAVLYIGTRRTRAHASTRVWSRGHQTIWSLVKIQQRLRSFTPSNACAYVSHVHGDNCCSTRIEAVVTLTLSVVPNFVFTQWCWLMHFTAAALDTTCTLLTALTLWPALKMITTPKWNRTWQCIWWTLKTHKYKHSISNERHIEDQPASFLMTSSVRLNFSVVVTICSLAGWRKTPMISCSGL